jgi:hypothetical protein
MHGNGETLHGGVEAMAPEPAQDLLRAVSKENHSQGKADDGHSEIRICVHDFAHMMFFLFADSPVHKAAMKASRAKSAQNINRAWVSSCYLVAQFQRSWHSFQTCALLQAEWC